MASSAVAATTPLPMEDPTGQCYVTQRFHFAAAHRLYNPALPDSENRAIFGKCANDGGHGHNYELIVTVSGVPDATAGWVIEREEFAAIVREAILDKVDHRNLNDVLDEEITTAENVAISAWRALEGQFTPAELVRIRVVETAKNTFDYFGPNGQMAGAPA